MERNMASEPEFANETRGCNLIPFAGMAGGWLAWAGRAKGGAAPAA